MTLLDVIYQFYWNLLCPSGDVGPLDTIMNFTLHIGDNLEDIIYIDYLALLLSLITLVAILLFCVFIIKKIIGIMFRLATGSSAF